MNLYRVSLMTILCVLMSFPTLAHESMSTRPDWHAIVSYSRLASDHKAMVSSLESHIVHQEKVVRELERAVPSFAHKWPSMHSQTVRQAKQELSRLKQLAEYHNEHAVQYQRLAVESLAK